MSDCSPLSVLESFILIIEFLVSACHLFTQLTDLYPVFPTAKHSICLSFRNRMEKKVMQFLGRLLKVICFELPFLNDFS